jgi:hypothetical protein
VPTYSKHFVGTHPAAITSHSGRKTALQLALCSHGRPRNLPPSPELVRHLLTVFGGREEVTPRPEVRGNGAIRGENALGAPWEFKSLHPSFPLPGRLVRIFRPVIEVAVLPMFYTGQDLALGSTVAPQLICDDDPWDIR